METSLDLLLHCNGPNMDRIQIEVLNTLPLYFFNFWLLRANPQNLKSSIGRESIFYLNLDSNVEYVLQ